MAPRSGMETSDEASEHRSSAVPARAIAQIMQFLVEARGSETVLQRAVASLGLLEEVALVEVDAEDAGGGCLRVELGQGESTRTLTVRLTNPGNVDARQAIDGLLTMVCSLFGREAQLETLRAQAHTDPLTGLWNRRGFEPFLDQALARATRTGEDVAVLLCDLDHFKQINDSGGHAAGDRALQVVAKALRNVIRPTDAAARLGGDEMALLLSGCCAQGATVVAERLRASLARAQEDAGFELPVTLSIGIADARCLSRSEMTERNVAALMEAADEAMYAAKRQGRDGYACHRKSFVPRLLDDEHTQPLSLMAVPTANDRSPTAA